jgi:hypothetical protein
MNRFVIGVVFSLAPIVCSPSNAFACRCVEPSVRMAYKRADVVVIAKVLKITSGPEPNAITAVLSVSQAWKRDIPTQITLVSGEDCVYMLGKDQEHVLYLTKDKAENLYGTVRCRGNKLVFKAQQALEWLRRYGKPAKIV